mgnify:CR=1 FL=1
MVALSDDKAVGHVGFSPVLTEGGELGLGLAPVAVLRDFRARGIGSRLIREGLDEARRRGHGFVVVLGDPDFYERFGFLGARARGLSDEYEGGEAFQVLELRPGGLPRPGLVRYAPEFAIVAQDGTA